MSRIFIKQVPRLVRQRLPHVQTLGATAVVATLEDLAYLRERDDSVKEVFTHCISRALALLPELRLSGIIRALFAYKRAEITSSNFLDEVSRFLLEECGAGQPFENMFTSCTANDILLLYKAFVVNDFINVRLHALCMNMLQKQTEHMLPSDCCIFFKTHTKCIEASERNFATDDAERVTLKDALHPPLAREITLRFLQRRDAIPEDITSFVEWLVPGSQYYGLSLDLSEEIASFYRILAQNPPIFNINHIHRLVQSTCLLHAYMPEQYHAVIKHFIVSLLHEAERRSDVHDYQSALTTFYALSSIDFGEFELLQGMLYCIVNNVDQVKDLCKVQDIIRRRIYEERNLHKTAIAADFTFTIERYPPSIQALKLHEIVERLEKRRIYLLS